MLKNNKLCLRMIGGIGNQLFAYSYGRSLAEKSGRKFFIDNSTGFIKDTYKRKSRVKSFLSVYNEASLFDKTIFLFTKYFPRTSRLIFNSIYIKERDSRSFEFLNSDKINKIGLVFIEGYFQSYMYFEKYKELIKDEIKLKFKKTTDIIDLNKKIDQCNSVSIHIRRIDYDPKLDIQYYIDAAKLINETISNPYFFIFSDDLQWCKEHLTFLKHKRLVSHESMDEVTDLWLMTHCKHHIIANSSFSWWGAWLSNHSGEIVIAPAKTQIGVIDNLYPKDWILI